LKKSNLLIGYLVSNNGKIISEKGKVLKPLDNGRGYLRINVKNKTYYIHRLVADAHIKNPLNKNCVNHIDGNKKNNNSMNLNKQIDMNSNKIIDMSDGTNPNDAVNKSPMV
jgi:hypothetical protein